MATGMVRLMAGVVVALGLIGCGAQGIPGRTLLAAGAPAPSGAPLCCAYGDDGRLECHPLSMPANRCGAATASAPDLSNAFGGDSTH